MNKDQRSYLTERKADTTGTKNHSQLTKEGLERAALRGKFPGRPKRVTDDQIRQAVALGTTAGAAHVGLTLQQFVARKRRLGLNDSMTDPEIITPNPWMDTVCAIFESLHWDEDNVFTGSLLAHRGAGRRPP